MPQEMHVLRCYDCHMFQVHIVKKSIKWNCKVCGKKQTLVKVFGRGTGKDCRITAQKLNELRRYQQIMPTQQNNEKMEEDTFSAAH